MQTVTPAEARALVVTLPMTPYKVWVGVGRGTYTVNLTSNSGDIKGAYWGRNPQFRALLVSRARQEMRDAAWVLTRQALDRSERPKSGPLRLDVRITTRTRAIKDRDNALAGLKACFDGMAQALGVNDSLFEVASVEFEAGTPEQTRIEVRGC